MASICGPNAFDRELRDIFEVQDEITLGNRRKIESETRAPSHISCGGEIERRLEAYDVYLEGKYNWNRQTEEGFNRAIHLL